eukprot:m.243783 g.243783  ORF g.243783 m.243783 type:complete len:480 (+) comp28528_c0_seq1:130-1569(+)
MRHWKRAGRFTPRPNTLSTVFAMKSIVAFLLLSTAQRARVFGAAGGELFVGCLTDMVTVAVDPAVTRVAADHGQVGVIAAVHNQAKGTEVACSEQHRAADAKSAEETAITRIARLGVLVAPASTFATGGGGATRGTLATRLAHPAASRNGLQLDAVSVIATIALVAEHQVLLIIGVAADGAGLALHALPVVRFDHRDEIWRELEARGVAGVVTLDAGDELLAALSSNNVTHGTLGIGRRAWHHHQTLDSALTLLNAQLDVLLQGLGLIRNNCCCRGGRCRFSWRFITVGASSRVAAERGRWRWCHVGPGLLQSEAHGAVKVLPGYQRCRVGGGRGQGRAGLIMNTAPYSLRGGLIHTASCAAAQREEVLIALHGNFLDVFGIGKSLLCRDVWLVTNPAWICRDILERARTILQKLLILLRVKLLHNAQCLLGLEDHDAKDVGLASNVVLLDEGALVVCGISSLKLWINAVNAEAVEKSA